VAEPIVETREGIQRSVVLELIAFFFEGRRDWILERLGAA